MHKIFQWDFNVLTLKGFKYDISEEHLLKKKKNESSVDKKCTLNRRMTLIFSIYSLVLTLSSIYGK